MFNFARIKKMELLVEDIVWLGVVTMLAAYQLGTFASRVGKCRTKHKIEPPSIDGPPDFQRIFRAQ